MHIGSFIYPINFMVINMSKEQLSFKIPAMRVHQREEGDEAIYVGKIRASDLRERNRERFVIHEWSSEPKEKQGYQRIPNSMAIQSVKDFLLEEVKSPLLPTAVLVNSRVPLDFRETSLGFGELYINQSLYIIDGQHRISAIISMMEEPEIRAKFEDYELPIVVLSGFDYPKEVEQFFVINSRQRRVKTNLAQRIYIELGKGRYSEGLIPESKKWQKDAVKIVDRLNKEIKDGIWYDLIELPNTSRDVAKTKVITQDSFVSSLSPFFVGPKAFWGADRIQERNHSEVQEEVANFLTKFWIMVAKLYPDIVANPRQYSLMKTVGTFSLHMLVGMIITDNVSKEEDLTEAINIAEEKLESVKDGFDNDFWRSDSSRTAKKKGLNASAYSSSAGHRRLATSILAGMMPGEI